MRFHSMHQARRFGADRRGTVAIHFGLAATMLMVTVGGAIDFNRWHSAKRVTSDALDAAVLAGARSLYMNPDNPDQALAVARTFYLQNTASKVDLHTNTIDFVLAADNKGISATGSATIKSTLLSLIGLDVLTVASETGASLPTAQFGGGGAGSDMEIAVMLDVTGSMCNDGVGPCTSGNKISALKSAATKLVDIAIPDDQSKYYAKMSLVPFSTRIRVAPNGNGSDIMKRLTDLDATWTGWMQLCTASTGTGDSETNGNWTCTASEAQHVSKWKIMPCVTDRFYNASDSIDTTDDAPGYGKWLNAHAGDRMPRSWDSTDEAAGQQSGQTKADPSYNWNYDPDGGCADVAQSNEITPLTSNKSELKSRIAGLEAYGSTSGSLGTAWAWYTLSPKWSGVWSGASVPAAYSETKTLQVNGRPKLRKVAILVSDGVYNTVRGWKDQDQQKASNYAKQMCEGMKAQGIEIFTVGLDLDSLPAAERAIAEDTLKTCGTDIKHFYSSLNEAELETAFQDIATQLSPIFLAR